jgi:hypothetical protein
LAFATIGPEWSHGGFITAGFAAVDGWAGSAHTGLYNSGFGGTRGGFHGRSWDRSSWGAGRVPGRGGNWHTARANSFRGWHEARGFGGFTGGHRH